MSDIIFKTLLVKGENGGNIKDIKKASTNGLVDTYTVTLTNGDTTTFKVTNGKSIVDIKKTGSTGLVDTYTITYNDGTTSSFMVTNGEGLQNLQVGGRNLYLGTKDFSGSSWVSLDSWNKKEEKYNGFTVMARNDRWGGLSQQINTKTGEIYTFSCYVKNTSDPATAIVITNSNDVNRATVDNGGLVIKQSPDFQRVSLAFSILSDGIIKPRVESNSGKNEISVCGLKLERGNIATDWTPAPEDLPDTSITNSDIDTILNS